MEEQQPQPDLPSHLTARQKSLQIAKNAANKRKADPKGKAKDTSKIKSPPKKKRRDPYGLSSSNDPIEEVHEDDQASNSDDDEETDSDRCLYDQDQSCEDDYITRETFESSMKHLAETFTNSSYKSKSLSFTKARKLMGRTCSSQSAVDNRSLNGISRFTPPILIHALGSMVCISS